MFEHYVTTTNTQLTFRPTPRAQAPTLSTAAPVPGGGGAPKRRANGGAPSNVRGFNNLRDEDDDDDDDKPTEWFTGGAQSGSVAGRGGGAPVGRNTTSDKRTPRSIGHFESGDAWFQPYETRSRITDPPVFAASFYTSFAARGETLPNKSYKLPFKAQLGSTRHSSPSAT